MSTGYYAFFLVVDYGIFISVCFHLGPIFIVVNHSLFEIFTGKKIKPLGAYLGVHSLADPTGLQVPVGRVDINLTVFNSLFFFIGVCSLLDSAGFCGLLKL